MRSRDLLDLMPRKFGVGAQEGIGACHSGLPDMVLPWAQQG